MRAASLIRYYPDLVSCERAIGDRQFSVSHHGAGREWDMHKQPRVSIEYCTQCRWLLRAAWMAQELLTTFQAELGAVALIPGMGGIFEVRVNEETIWSHKAQRRFPESKELKQLVRDRIAPGKNLGHSDR